MARIIPAFTQFFDDNGEPLVDGFLKFVESGTNNTDKETFSDVSETISNTNPVELDGAGRCPSVFGTGSYNVISFINVSGSPGAQIQQFDPVSGNAFQGAFSDWNAVTIYGKGDIIIGSDGLYYRSLVANNQNQEPTVSPGQWEEIKFLGVWNTNITYEISEVVLRSGIFYTSLISGNIGNDPLTNPSKWGYNVASGSIFGLSLSNAADADHDITISIGSSMDSTSIYPLNLASSLTKQIDAAWSIGDAAGGLFSGTVANDTWYHTFLIRKDSDGSIDAGFDTSVTAANIPAGYTAYRRLGSVLTDGSANILPFLQRGNNFMWNAPINEWNAVVGTGSGTSVTISTPFDVKTEAVLFAASTSLAATTLYMRISNVEATDLAVTFSSATHVNGDTNAGWRSGGIIEVFTDLGSHIRARTDLSSGVVINTLGWNDDRGQN